MDQLLDVKRAALALGCSSATIRKWIAMGRLPAVKVGARLVRVRESDLERMLAVRRHT